MRVLVGANEMEFVIPTVIPVCLRWMQSPVELVGAEVVSDW